MAVPFRKVSKTRRDKRRTHYKISANGLVKCSNCGEMIRPHRICPACGFYKKEDRLNKTKVEENVEVTKETKKENPKAKKNEEKVEKEVK